jgi:hypothetical protein
MGENKTFPKGASIRITRNVSKKYFQKTPKYVQNVLFHAI